MLKRNCENFLMLVMVEYYEHIFLPTIWSDFYSVIKYKSIKNGWNRLRKFLKDRISIDSSHHYFVYKQKPK